MANQVATQEIASLARGYLKKVLDRDKAGAVRLIVDSAQAGAPIEDLYLEVLQPVQREIGRLWQTNEITVAQEHYCTAVTQLVMSQLYSYVFTKKRIGHRMVMTCIGGELHEVGARMVADFFEIRGWDTYFMGANTPAESVISAIVENEAELIGVSTTINYGVTAARDLIEKIKSNEALSNVSVLVGGRPFLLSDSLWQATGADGFAPDAREAVALGERLVVTGGGKHE
jgi:MerR family transcriptional regulator, light-induced transcriptional regulator